MSYPRTFLENIPANLNEFLPDYHSKLKELHRLVDKRGGYTDNLTLEEHKVYNYLVQWYESNHS